MLNICPQYYCNNVSASFILAEAPCNPKREIKKADFTKFLDNSRSKIKKAEIVLREVYAVLNDPHRKLSDVKRLLGDIQGYTGLKGGQSKSPGVKNNLYDILTQLETDFLQVAECDQTKKRTASAIRRRMNDIGNLLGQISSVEKKLEATAESNNQVLDNKKPQEGVDPVEGAIKSVALLWEIMTMIPKLILDW
jgi:DNA repair ATPase RecN